MLSIKKTISKVINFISLFGSTLWSGSWNAGSVNVPNTDKYKAFILMQAGQSILAIKRSTSLYVDGYTIIGSSSGTQYIKAFSAAINGNTWTYRWANEIAHNASGSHGAPKTNEEITQIIGFIPDLGGVLHSSIFKAFSHLRKIGGGLNASCEEFTGVDAYLDIKTGSFHSRRHRLWRSTDDYTKSFRLACCKRRSERYTDNSSNNKNNARWNDSFRRHRTDGKGHELTYRLLCEKRQHIHSFNIQGNANQCDIILNISGRRWAIC